MLLPSHKRSPCASLIAAHEVASDCTLADHGDDDGQSLADAQVAAGELHSMSFTGPGQGAQKGLAPVVGRSPERQKCIAREGPDRGQVGEVDCQSATGDHAGRSVGPEVHTLVLRVNGDRYITEGWQECRVVADQLTWPCFDAASR